MLRLIKFARTGTNVASFRLENGEVARVSGNCNEIASTWSFDGSDDENVAKNGKQDED